MNQNQENHSTNAENAQVRIGLVMDADRRRAIEIRLEVIQAEYADNWKRHINALLHFGIPDDFDPAATQDFIAHAPADLRALLDAVDALTAERDALLVAVEHEQQAKHAAWNEQHKLLTQVVALEVDMQRVHDLLEQYAAENDRMTASIIIASARVTARKALGAALDGDGAGGAS